MIMMMLMMMIQVLANSSSVGFRRLISLHSPKCVNPISSSLPWPPKKMNERNQTNKPQGDDDDVAEVVAF